jgi:hypothetical protein
MFSRTLIITVAIIVTGGCTTPMGVPPMGDAYRQQLHAQQVEPGYAAPTPVTGLDGKSAAKVHGEYLKGESCQSDDDSGDKKKGL